MNDLSWYFIILGTGIVALGSVGIWLSMLVSKLYKEIDSLQPPF
jgi:hypothetical protein